MFRYLTIAIAIAILTSFNFKTVTSEKQEKVIVDVYYESLCPYSISFITKELVPAYKYLKDFVTINFVPFGIAKYEIGKTIKFTCQHGSNECYGNKAQACALGEILRTVDLESERQEKSVNVIGCAMGNSKSTSAVPQCAKKFGFSEESINSIKKCIESELGDLLLIAYAAKTKAFESPIKYVPAVTINRVKNEDATSNFIGEICKHISKSNQPDVCNQSQS